MCTWGVNWAAVGCWNKVSGGHQGPAERPGRENGGEVGRRHRFPATLGPSAQVSGRKWGDGQIGCLLPTETAMGQWVCGGHPFGPGQGWGPGGASLCGCSKHYRQSMTSFLRVCLFADKRSHIGLHSPANLKFDLCDLNLEEGQQHGMEGASYIQAPVLGSAASGGYSGGPRGCVCTRVCAGLLNILAVVPVRSPSTISLSLPHCTREQ